MFYIVIAWVNDEIQVSQLWKGQFNEYFWYENISVTATLILKMSKKSGKLPTVLDIQVQCNQTISVL